MSLILNFFIFILGIFFLVKGSGIFVKSGASIAKRLGVSTFVIGLTLIALGTSLPELFSSIFASAKKSSGLIIGIIIGANIANLSLINGLASIIHPIKIKREVLRRDAQMVLFSVLILALSLIDKKISRIEGMIFILFYLSYTIFLFELKNSKRKNKFKDFARFFFRLKYFSSIKKNLLGIFDGKKHSRKKMEKREMFRDFLLLVMGGAFIYFGAKYAVKEALFFAGSIGISGIIMGVLISIGTTLPEMSVAISASRKKLGNLVIGNSLGSCITNTFLILGISSLIYPLIFVKSIVYFALGFLAFINLIMIIFIRSEWKLEKIEGIILSGLYIIFLILLFSGIF